MKPSGRSVSFTLSFIFSLRLTLVLLASLLTNALAARAQEAKVVTVTNNSGGKASDLHMIFKGTGGDLSIDPMSLVSPAGCDQGTPSTSSNGLDIVWQPDGCVDSNSTVSFRISTNGPGPLEFGGGYWTGPRGAKLNDLRVGDVVLSPAANFRLLVPELVQQSEKFTGMVVEQTPNGYTPASQGDKVVFNGQVLPQEPSGKYSFPPFERKVGNYFMGVLVVPSTVTQEDARHQSLPISTQHIEVMPETPQMQTGATEIAHASSVISPGTPLRVEGKNLLALQKASLVNPQGNQIALGESAGSSLQRIYLPNPSTPMPAGNYRYVAWDATGKRYAAPNTSQRPKMELNGPPIKKRGQRGEFTLLSDTSGLVELTGGQPIISLDERMVQLRANEPRKVKFTAQQVGQYSVEVRLFSPEDLPPSVNAPRANSKPQAVTTRYDPQNNRTFVDAPVAVTDAADKPLANVPVDIALSYSGGLDYARVTTDSGGHATLTRTLLGNVPASAVSTHVYRVLDHKWKEPEGIAGGGAFTVGLCPDECTPPEVGPCLVDHIHITLNPAQGGELNVEETNKNFDFMAVMEGVASVVEPSPASGASGASLGAAEVAKGLVEQLDKQKDKLKQYGHITITLVLQRSWCVRELCGFLAFHHNVWRKETFDEKVIPPQGLAASETEWVGAYFDLRNADVRQALKDAYQKALKKCEGGGQTADRGICDPFAKSSGN